MSTRPMPSPLRYDLKLWVATRGREGAFRQRQLDRARIVAGETVLDVGCGTGTLAIAAARRVGPSGAVHGIDPSEDLLRRARKKARRAAGVDVDFLVGSGEALPFADESFDLVLTTLVLHHLPHDALRDSVREMRRVLRPMGRLLIVDIGGAQEDGKRTMHAPHGGHVGFDLEAVAPRLAGVGLRELESGPIDSGMRRLEQLRYLLATAA